MRKIISFSLFLALFTLPLQATLSYANSNLLRGTIPLERIIQSNAHIADLKL